ncbi:MAG: hypothetical protein CMJ64_11235 [Planctomycetaceae bacterium]|nr:hypothetical protein [Planctomycetaceae bacterium]
MLRRTYVWMLTVVYCFSLVGCGASSVPTSEVQLQKREQDEVMRFAIAPEAETPSPDDGIGPGMGGDKHALIVENSFVPVQQSPLSTFSIDVDTASYSKARMHLMQHGELPPEDAVRIEEMINYFDYSYSAPVGPHPFSVHVEVADAPWKPGHRLARIGLKGKELERQRPASNLVFLLDVSGSMDYANKLPLVKQGMRLLTSQLTENDRIAIVVYAGAAGLVLPTTLGDNRHRILEVLDQLHAGGSTNGGQGIQLAYHVAEQNFVRGGVNRVILCTDGDFNVGATGSKLVRLAEQQAKRGVHLSVLGFGMGNHNDAMLEELSNKADGNYAFIDNEHEARKVLLEQVNSTLVTIAEDVKIQVEFNPAHVAAYRLIGYENRHLEAHEFNDDKKDAGEIGAGHTVTALYEIVPAGEASDQQVDGVDPLKYQKRTPLAGGSSELMTVKLRYKEPNESKSKLIVATVKNSPVRFGQATHDFQFASAVAAFGMLLRDSESRGDATYSSVLEIANATRGEDRHGYRGEFVQMVATAGRLAGEQFPAVSYVLPVYEQSSQSPPAVVHYAPAAVQPQSGFAFRGDLLIWAVVFVSAIVAICAVTIAILLGTRFLVLPMATEAEQHAWPCTQKQRGCTTQKPPVRKLQGAWR